MPLDQNALSSLSASLDDLTTRLGEVARQAGDDDDALIDVLEVERQLQTAGRRLTKILRRVGPGSVDRHGVNRGGASEAVQARRSKQGQAHTLRYIVQPFSCRSSLNRYPERTRIDPDCATRPARREPTAIADTDRSTRGQPGPMLARNSTIRSAWGGSTKQPLLAKKDVGAPN